MTSITSEVRLRREPPERSGPMRTSALAFRSPSSSGARNGGPRDGAPEATKRAVESAVDSAYRVYEDYLRWGQQAAGIRPQTNREGPTMKQPPDVTTAMFQMMRMWQDMTQKWMGFAMPFAPFPGMSGGLGGHSQAAETTASTRAMEVELKAAPGQRAQVNVQLQQVGRGARLSTVVEQVGGTATMDAVRFDTGAGSRVSLSIPPGMPEGKYYGTIVDDRTRECGALTVRLER